MSPVVLGMSYSVNSSSSSLNELFRWFQTGTWLVARRGRMLEAMVAVELSPHTMIMGRMTPKVEQQP